MAGIRNVTTISFLIFIICIITINEIYAKPIVSPFYKPKPGHGYEKEHYVKDNYYKDFAKGKKNQIATVNNMDTHKTKLTREALLKATSAQTTALVAAAQAARSSLEISKLAKKAQEISVRRANWVLQTVRTAAKAEEVAVNAIESLFM
ncbi:uncharacterized protein LOC116303259 [Actinia tenebrosa]|uniref:Uncharacterized protein LOC116303259 n=1 Tax=Actinia tenebrosa TaxID=6105 RepID=A0A6P8INL0_ACTTE|nr:uncharacterized protein LOC116303259 [Actinia tenebrosa]